MEISKQQTFRDPENAIFLNFSDSQIYTESSTETAVAGNTFKDSVRQYINFNITNYSIILKLALLLKEEQ